MQVSPTLSLIRMVQEPRSTSQTSQEDQVALLLVKDRAIMITILVQLSMLTRILLRKTCSLLTGDRSVQVELDSMALLLQKTT